MFSLLALIHVASAAPKEIAFLSNKGVLFVQVYKAPTMAADLSHNHAIQAVGWSGKGIWDSEDYSACDISFAVPVNNLQVDNQDIRKLAGLEGTLSESMRKDIKKHMLSNAQLDGEKYPMITFKSTSCEGSGNKMTLNGDFTMHGTTNAISLPVSVSDTDGLSLKGSFPVKSTDFGMTPYTAMFGLIGNQDEMKITFDLVAADQ